MMLSAQDHARIAEAVKAAEAKTSGEIFCIVTGEVSQYRETPLAWGAAAALIVPPLLLVFGLQPWVWVEHYMGLVALGAADRGGGWTAGDMHVATQTLIVDAIGAYALAQTVLFAMVAFVVAIPPIRRALTPRFLKQHRVRRTAYAHFASTGLINDPGRTGVLVFASLKDRQVQIVADKGIHDAVGDKVWNTAVGALVEGMKRRDPGQGFVKAIDVCGEALAAHFPADGPKDNRFSDELVEV